MGWAERRSASSRLYRRLVIGSALEALFFTEPASREGREGRKGIGRHSFQQGLRDLERTVFMIF